MKLDFAKRVIYRKKSDRIHFWVKILSPFCMCLVVYNYKQQSKYNPDENPGNSNKVSVLEWVGPTLHQLKLNFEILKSVYIDKSTTMEEVEEKAQLDVEALREKVHDFPEVLAELKGIKMPQSIDEIKLEDIISGKVKELTDEEEKAFLRTLDKPPRA